MHLRVLFKIALIGIVVMIPILYVLKGSPLVNVYSLILTELFCVLLLIELQFLKLENPFLRIANFTLIFFILGRVLTIIILPDSNLLFGYAAITPEQITNSLFFILASYLVFYLSLYLSRDRFAYQQLRNTVGNFYSKVDAWFFLFVLLFLVIYGFQISSARYNPDAEKGGSIISYLFNALNLFALLIPLWLLRWAALSKSVKISSVAMIVLYIVTSVLVGKRSAIAGLVFIMLASYFFTFENPYIPAKAMAYLAIGTILSVVVIFPLATAIRYASVSNLNSSFDLVSSAEQFTTVLNLGFSLFERFISIIAMRLGFLDYAVIAISNTLDPGIYDPINILHNLVNVLDRVIPGVSFADTLPSTRMFAVAYLGDSLEHAKGDYLTQIFTVYGINYVMFGGWFSLLLVFPMFFILNKFLLYIYKLKSFYWYPFIVSVIISCWDMFFQNFGYDTIIVQMIYFNIGGYILLFSGLFLRDCLKMAATSLNHKIH